jgi:mutator protein MutT
MFEIAVSCWVKKDNKYLLQRRNLKEKWGPGKWIIPGGHIEEGETIIKGLERELQEEVGIKINTKSIRIIKDYYFPHENYGKIILVVQADILSGEASVKDDSLEIGWFNIEELDGIDFVFETSKQEIKLLD